ncbi:unnamed protein product [Gongylonema pulchrum]|uniref:Uncharacterized protein n=1 Tax=Gongylonema pulchrum TaxID=637853 RepID=A0A3P6S590_9BILA|nr:unnamed protein product [Gongylonema pulchrum]
MTLSISSNDLFLAVGMGNLLEFSMRDGPGGEAEDSKKTYASKKTGMETLMQMEEIAPVEQHLRGGTVQQVGLTAPPVPQMRLNKVDLFLRRFKHWKVVDMLFRDRYYRSRPDIVVSALNEM